MLQVRMVSLVRTNANATLVQGQAFEGKDGRLPGDELASWQGTAYANWNQIAFKLVAEEQVC